jgi:BirA family biotin operon repressor/biotin-[acetyl-CoA-carboxylase] ligase
MPREIPLVLAHGLACDGTDAQLQLDDLVDEEERLTMGQDRLDLCPPERRLKAGCHEPPSLVTMDTLAAENVVPRLRGRFGRPYLYVETCPSTQRLLGSEHVEGAVAVAEEQTEGRGRLGRTWVSPPGVSILCSVLLEPAVETPQLPELTVIAGEACAEAIGRVTGLEPRIKLPNDVLLRERKVAGILAEARDGRVVLGVGINVNVEPAELPQDVAKPATSLLGELGEPVDRAELLVTLLESLEQHYDCWLAQ